MSYKQSNVLGRSASRGVHPAKNPLTIAEAFNSLSSISRPAAKSRKRKLSLLKSYVTK
jgi:hypothetical protein